MIVAVTGGKGGVGKSTTSLNLGYELDAVIVDGDLATADLPPGTGPDLHDVLAGRAKPMDAVERIGPIRYLPCGRTLAGARAADLAALSDAVEQLERKYGRVVIDCPAGIARDVGTQIETAHLAVLVTTPDEAALVDAFRTRRVIADLETPVASGVLNRTDLDDHDELASRVEERFSATTTIVEDRATIDEAQSQWLPVDEVDPDSPAVGAFDGIAWTVQRCEQRISSRIGVL